MGLTLHPSTGSNTFRLFFKSTPRRLRRRHGRAGALARDAAAGHLRRNEMPGLQLLVQRLARKRLARDRDPPNPADVKLSKMLNGWNGFSIRCSLCVEEGDRIRLMKGD